MNKRSGIYIIFVLIMLLSLTGCSRGMGAEADSIIVKDLNGIKESMINEYNIEVDLNTENMTYTGKQTVSYVNNTDIDLDDLYFHLYPNAFGTLEESPVLFDRAKNMNSSSYIGGYIEIEKASIKDKDLEWNIQGDKDTILHISLEKALKKGKSIELYLEYKVKLPSTEDRFGYHDKGINFGNWYPIACVYDSEGWNLDPYYKLGDPFYSEISNYNVQITVPKEMIVGASGNIVSEIEDGDKKVYNVEGRLIRDFAWVASKDFIVKEMLVDGTVIKLYSLEDDKDLMDKSLGIGGNAISSFNKIFGKYPYGQYSIIITKFPSGMEYPGIVFVSDDYFRKSALNILETVIVHETAHQWWYGLVGSDQIDQAWLDESLATYSEVIYMKEIHGKSSAEDYYDQNIKLGYEYASSYLGENEVVNKPLMEFSGWDDYGPLVYSRGAMFINAIKEQFGEEVLYEILGRYFEKYIFHIATTEDFLRVCEELTKTSFDSLEKEYLNGNK